MAQASSARCRRVGVEQRASRRKMRRAPAQPRRRSQSCSCVRAVVDGCADRGLAERRAAADRWARPALRRPLLRRKGLGTCGGSGGGGDGRGGGGGGGGSSAGGASRRWRQSSSMLRTASSTWRSDPRSCAVISQSVGRQRRRRARRRCALGGEQHGRSRLLSHVEALPRERAATTPRWRSMLRRPPQSGRLQPSRSNCSAGSRACRAC